MPALPEDIAPGIRRARVEAWESAAVKVRYPSARDGSVQPAEGFFDNAADGAAAIAARGAIFGTERRRFTVRAAELIWPDPAAAGIPTITLNDPEQKVNGPMIAARIEINLEDERTAYEVFG